MDLPPRVLVIAGSDSSGGAGLQRDLAVLAKLNVRAVTALTAVTAQSNSRVHSVAVLLPNLIRDQIIAAQESGAIAAIKVGMLGNADAVVAVAECLSEIPGVPVVVDPVLASSSGTPLLDKAGRQALLEQLLPRTALLTPNLPEAAILLGVGGLDPEGQAQQLVDMGLAAVLLKGGHGGGDQAVDLLLQQGKPPLRLSAPRLPVSMRGTGCALSTAICAALANGACMAEACQIAKALVFKLMQEELALRSPHSINSRISS